MFEKDECIKLEYIKKKGKLFIKNNIAKIHNIQAIFCFDFPNVLIFIVFSPIFFDVVPLVVKLSYLS